MMNNYLHIHTDGDHGHADGETYRIVVACEDHTLELKAKYHDVEHVTEVDADDEPCDICVEEHLAEPVIRKD